MLDVFVIDAVLDLCVSVDTQNTHEHRLLDRVRKCIVRAHNIKPTMYEISSRPGLCASCTPIIQKPTYNLVVPTFPLKDLTIANYHLLYIGLNIIIIAKYDRTIFRREARK